MMLDVNLKRLENWELTVVALVHDTKHDLAVRGVFRGDIGPQRSKYGVGGAALTNDCSIYVLLDVHMRISSL